MNSPRMAKQFDGNPLLMYILQHTLVMMQICATLHHLSSKVRDFPLHSAHTHPHPDAATLQARKGFSSAAPRQVDRTRGASLGPTRHTEASSRRAGLNKQYPRLTPLIDAQC